MEDALRTIFNTETNVVGAGRTDTGVHATGQVAHFKTDSTMETMSICRALNSLLPKDIVILRVEEADAAFHARFSATSRRYLYRITLRKKAICRQYAWYIHSPLNMDEIVKGTGFLQGQHNFQSFCATESDVSNHICSISNLYWDDEKDELTFHIEADRFLQHMVRTIVGTLVEVGRGRWQASEIERILHCRDRRQAGPTAPAHGLYLTEVKYD